MPLLLFTDKQGAKAIQVFQGETPSGTVSDCERQRGHRGFLQPRDARPRLIRPNHSNVHLSRKRCALFLCPRRPRALSPGFVIIGGCVKRIRRKSLPILCAKKWAGFGCCVLPCPDMTNTSPHGLQMGIKRAPPDRSEGCSLLPALLLPVLSDRHSALHAVCGCLFQRPFLRPLLPPPLAPGGKPGVFLAICVTRCRSFRAILHAWIVHHVAPAHARARFPVSIFSFIRLSSIFSWITPM